MSFTTNLGKYFPKPEHLLKVKVFDKDDVWSADLVELCGEQPQFKYILTVIDLYTEYAWAVPLPNKKGQTVAEAFKRIMNESGRKPNKVWVDKGKEFYNHYVKALPFEIYSALNDGKAVVVERFNCTLKQMMFKKFTSQGHKKWLKILPKIIDKYNNKVHSAIKTTPMKASENPASIRGIVLKNNFENDRHSSLKKILGEMIGFPGGGVNECIYFPGVWSLSATCPRTLIYILLMYFKD